MITLIKNRIVVGAVRVKPMQGLLPRLATVQVMCDHVSVSQIHCDNMIKNRIVVGVVRVKPWLATVQMICDHVSVSQCHCDNVDKEWNCGGCGASEAAVRTAAKVGIGAGVVGKVACYPILVKPATFSNANAKPIKSLLASLLLICLSIFSFFLVACRLCPLVSCT